MKSQKTSAKSLSAQFVDTIRDRILSGEVAAGSPLRQVPLSKEFGVAQSVVREGLSVLEQLGLVRRVEQLGVFVRDLSGEELVAAYQLRAVLEGLAARLCCQTASRANIEWLEAAARAIHEARENPSREERSELEYRFHQRFLELSGNGTLVRLSLGYRFVGNLVTGDRDPDELLREHLAIVRAVADNDPKAAEELARQHVENSANSLSRSSSWSRPARGSYRES